MRTPPWRFLIGLVLVIAVCVTAALLWQRSNEEPAAGPATLNCLGGSEKTELMADPELRRILADKFQLSVEFTPMGSYDLVRLPAADLDNRGVTCLWPSSASAQSVFESAHPGEFSGYRAENVLQSPEVIYAGPRGTAALTKAGLGKGSTIDLRTLLAQHVLKKSTWDKLGAEDLRGPVGVASTDAVKSNSGFVLAQLQLNIFATDDPYAAPNLAEAKAALPTMRKLYDAQGLQARSSESGFREWLTQGGEFKAPLYAGYENQVIQQLVRSGDNTQTLTDNVRVLYPEPTIYSDHPILALDGDAARFIEAMKDPEVQAIAWRTYGFRSATQVGVNDVAQFAGLNLAAQFRTTPPPAADVTLALLACLADATKCA